MTSEHEGGRGARIEGETKTMRLHYLDWLRVLAMLSIFLFHNAKLFDLDPWHVDNPQTTLAATVFVSFFNIWMMPLFFILSGAAVYYSLGRRTTGEFIKERSLRIALPWIVLGMLIIAPPQVYLERLSNAEFTGNFFQFYPHYFEGLYGFGGNFAWMGLHLWYLMLLFGFSLVALPLLLRAARTGAGPLSRLATKIDRPWLLPLFVVPLGLAGLIADAAGLSITREMGSWDVLSYSLFFLSGYLIISNTRIQDTIRRYALAALASAVVLTAIHLILEFAVRPSIYDMGLDLRILCTWSWIIAILGCGRRFLNFSNRFLSYANEAVLPFYILHQTVIVVVGFFVVQSSMSIVAKYLIVSTASLTVIVIIYDVLVRRVNALRFLFGMRSKSERRRSGFVARPDRHRVNSRTGFCHRKWYSLRGGSITSFLP